VLLDWSNRYDHLVGAEVASAPLRMSVIDTTTSQISSATMGTKARAPNKMTATANPKIIIFRPNTCAECACTLSLDAPRNI
jgi:hypothetical protein